MKLRKPPMKKPLPRQGAGLRPVPMKPPMYEASLYPAGDTPMQRPMNDFYSPPPRDPGLAPKPMPLRPQMRKPLPKRPMNPFMKSRLF